MSEEEKQMFNKMIYCNLINGEQALKFNRKYKDLQQKVEQQEKEIDRLNNIIKQIEELCDKHELGKYDYSVPVFELNEVIKSEYRKHNK